MDMIKPRFFLRFRGGRELHFHRRLSFKRAFIAETEQRSDAVKKPAGARCHRRLDSTFQQRTQNRGFAFTETQ